MPLSNMGVRYCHINIYNCSFNGSFTALYTTDILREVVDLSHLYEGLFHI